MRDRARRCTAQSKRTGKRCRGNVYRKPDGSYTTTCRVHSGGHQLREPGDPRNGGREPTSYRDVKLVPEPWREFHVDARGQAGRLEEELALLRTNLARLRFSQLDKPGMGELERNRAEGELIERIARVEQRRAIVLKTLQELDDPPPPPGSIPAVGAEPEDPEITDDARQRLRDKLLRDED